MAEAEILVNEVEEMKDVEFEEMKAALNHDPAEGRCCKPCWRLVTHEKFDMYVGIVIVANVMVMSLEHYQQDQMWTYLTNVINLGFTVFFVLEALVKMMGLGCCEFWSSRWNQFDVFVVLVSVGSLYLEMFNTSPLAFNPTLLRILRVFRVARLVRFFNVSLGLQALLSTITRALPSILNVALVMVLLFYIYACGGVEIFGKSGCEMSDCEGLSRNGNFADFPTAMLMLFRLATGDDGYGIIKDMMRSPPQCNDAITCEVDCCATGGGFVAVLYFVTFGVFSRLVLLNIVVAILMVQLNDANEEVLLEAIASQSERIDEMEGDELLKKLGLEEEVVKTEFESKIMKAKREQDEMDRNRPKWDLDKTASKKKMVDRTEEDTKKQDGSDEDESDGDGADEPDEDPAQENVEDSENTATES